MRKKLFFALPFLPVILLMFTKYNAYISDVSTCTSQYGPLIWYTASFSIILLVWSTKNLGLYYKDSKAQNVKKQIRIIIWALSFIVFCFLSVTLAAGYFSSEEVYMLTPVGIVIFIGLLAYAITKYQFLNIKLIAAQVLTYATWILIGSQYFFADSLIVYLLVSLTLLLSIMFGIMLIKSVKEESERKEQLQLMADKLAVANDELRKLDNAKTEFISIASHQLRTPMTAIKGFVSLILEGTYGDISPQVRGALDKVYVSGEHLIHLVEDLLNVSRIESGRMQYTMEQSDLAEIINELMANFALVAKGKNLYLDLNLPPEGLPEIIMDKGKIREVVSNLIDNALKYSEKGGATVSAEVVRKGTVIGPKSPDTASSEKGEPIDGDAIRLTVSDTGVGIPADEMSYLFKKFSRGKDVARLHVGGTGLGIYVAKNIMEAHHGRIWVESEGAGKGSRFIMELPIA